MSEQTLPEGDGAPTPLLDVPPAEGERPEQTDPHPEPAKPLGRRRGRPRGDASETKPGRRTYAPRRVKTAPIGERVSQLYTMAGMAVAMIPAGPSAVDPDTTVTQAIGLAVATSADACGAAWQKLAEDNPRVRAALERMLTVSSFGELIAAHVPILIVAGLVSGALPAVLGDRLDTLGAKITPAP